MPITYPFTVDIPEPLATYYFDLSRENGKKIPDLIVRDLQEYHEARRYKANVRECGHR